MINLQLSDNEARLLALLLKMAGDTYSNHGCNDFHLGQELKLSPEETAKAAAGLREALVQTGCLEPDQEETSPYFLDWLLMRHFQVKVEALLRQGHP